MRRNKDGSGWVEDSGEFVVCERHEGVRHRGVAEMRV